MVRDARLELADSWSQIKRWTHPAHLWILNWQNEFSFYSLTTNCFWIAWFKLAPLTGFEPAKILHEKQMTLPNLSTEAFKRRCCSYHHQLKPEKKWEVNHGTQADSYIVHLKVKCPHLATSNPTPTPPHYPEGIYQSTNQLKKSNGGPTG